MNFTKAIKIYIYILIAFFSKCIIAQNLVLNPSLEDYNGKYPAYWKRITLTPDIYTNNIKIGFSDAKLNGYYPQHIYNDLLKKTSGNTYFGLVTTETGFGEMIGGTLKSPLIENMIYTVKLKAISSKTFGIKKTKTVNVLITDSILEVKSDDKIVKYNLPFIYPYQKDSSEIFSRDNWVDIYTNYVAKGGEKYIYINSQNLLKEKGALSVCFDSIGVYPTNIFINKPVSIDSIFFESGKDKLTTDSQKRLDKTVVIFNENRNFKISINGHTDDQGSSDKNLQLSINRSKTVMNYLILKGIPKSRLLFKGYGDKKPIDDNNTHEGRSKNRRIEFEFIR